MLNFSAKIVCLQNFSITAPFFFKADDVLDLDRRIFDDFSYFCKIFHTNMTRISRLYILILLLPALLWSCGNSRHDNAKPVLAVSLAPESRLLEALAGDSYEIVTVLENGANPELFETPMGRRVAVDRSRVYFKNGGLPFEDAILATLPDSVRVVDISEGITPIYGTHGHHHGHEAEEHEGHEHHHGEGFDPHIWTSVKNARVMASNMARGLIDLDPSQADAVNSRLAALDARLDSADRAIAARLDSAGADKFLVWHPSLSYFARDYGLTQIAVGQESKEVPVGRLKEIIDTAAADSITTFFFQKEYDSRQAETVSRELGISYETIDLLSRDWLEELNKITDVLTR